MIHRTKVEPENPQQGDLWIPPDSAARPYLIPLGSLIALGLLSVVLIAVFEWR